MKLTVKSGLIALMQVGLIAVVTGAALVPAFPVAAQMQMQKASPFAAASAVWAKVETSAAELDKTVKAGKLSEVHEIAFAIRDDVVTLPAKSAALSADKKKKLLAYSKTVSEVAELLDKYGDSNNAKGVKAQQERMKTTLKAIKALYPVGAFKAMPHSKMPPMKGMKGMKMEPGDHKKMEKGSHDH